MTSDGVGPEKAIVAPVTVNVTAGVVVPPGVVTVTLLAPSAAPAVIVNVAVIVVGLTTVTALTVTPPPVAATVVPVVVKLDPVRVTGTAVPRRPVLGAIVVRVGVAGLPTVNATVLVAPIAVVRLRLLAASVAVGVIVMVAVTVVAFTTVMAETLTPVPAPVTAVVPVRPVPVKVTGTLVPRVPEAGLIDVRVAPVTVNVTALEPTLAPPAVVTVTSVVASVAVAEIAQLAVSEVPPAFTTIVEQVTPAVSRVMAVVPVNPVPAMVTGTVVPRTPVVGVIEVTVGAGGAITVKMITLLVPPTVVTLRLWLPSGVSPPMLRLAVAVTPPGATVMAPNEMSALAPPVVAADQTAPVRLAPVRVTVTVVPANTLLGEIEARYGTPAAVELYSTAPGSKSVSAPVSGLGLPKKSVLGTRLKFASEVGMLSMANVGE